MRKHEKNQSSSHCISFLWVTFQTNGVMLVGTFNKYIEDRITTTTKP